MCGALLLASFVVILNRLRFHFISERLSLREFGIQYGNPLRLNQGVHYRDIEGFHICTKTEDGFEYHTLQWLPKAAQYADITVMPDHVNAEEAR